MSVAARGLVEHLGGLLGGARVELDEQVHDDLVLVVLVVAHVGEELARAVIAERRVGERVGRLGARAGLDRVGIDRDRARRDPGRAGDHALPAVLDRLDAAVVEAEVRLVVHAVEALHDGLLDLVDDLAALPADGVDAVDSLVVDLDLELLRPASVAAQPRADRVSRTFHLNPFYAPARGNSPPGAGHRRGSARGLRGLGAERREQVRATLAEFQRATEARDYQALCDRVLAPKLIDTRRADRAPVRDSARRRASRTSENPRLTVGAVKVEKDTATAEVRSSAAGESPSQDTVELVRVGGGLADRVPGDLKGA